MSVNAERLKELEATFLGPVMNVFEEELDAMLANPVPVERIDRWIGIVEASGMNWAKKLFATRVLRKKRRLSERKERIVLSGRERSALVSKAADHLPGVLVRVWLASLLAHARRNGMALRLSSLDDSMIPAGMPPMELDPRFEAFGIGAAQARRALLLARRGLSGAPIPSSALEWLASQGVLCE